jgi:DNA-binding CsgD family transcriptional regulator/sugar lactone lactonase YvrE
MGVGTVDGGPARLSRRELEVARLVAEGLTNREIAKRLFISERTVDGHLEHVREKLGVNTRAQVAAWVVRLGTATETATTAEAIAQPARRERRVPRRSLILAAVLLIALAVSAAGVLRLYPWAPRLPSGPTIQTIAGIASSSFRNPGGYSGDDGRASNAALSLPSDVVASRDGTIYIADYGNRVIRRIAHQTISTWVGGGSAPLMDGALAWTVDLGCPSSVAVDAHGQLYVLTSTPGSDLQVWTVRPDSTVGLVVNLGPRPDECPADFYNPPVGGLTVAPDGTLYIADRIGNQVFKWTSDRQLSPYAGRGRAGFSGDNGPASGADLDGPIGLALDSAGDLYIADTNNNRIREVNRLGVITTVAGSGTYYNDSGDGGLAVRARLAFPFGIAVTRDGSLFIADTGNNRVREVTAKGIIFALAGKGQWGYAGDNGRATEAELAGPEAVAVDGNGDLLIADTANNRLRQLVLSR